MSFQFTGSAMPPANLPPFAGDLTSKPEPIRLTLTGSPWAIQTTIKSLHKLGYAEPNDWSKPQPTGRPSEMMTVLIKKIRKEPQ